MEKEKRILPYYSSKQELPNSFKVNRRGGVDEKIIHYKTVVNQKELKNENIYNPYINEMFKTSIKIRKK